MLFRKMIFQLNSDDSLVITFIFIVTRHDAPAYSSQCVTQFMQVSCQTHLNVANVNTLPYGIIWKRFIFFLLTIIWDVLGHRFTMGLYISLWAVSVSWKANKQNTAADAFEKI
ncbi:hypothetical protein Ancab_033853 [Ancistrocladus abbreviatus]